MDGLARTRWRGFSSTSREGMVHDVLKLLSTKMHGIGEVQRR